MADLSSLLSPADRAKLARQVGITLEDGRVLKGGRILSAQDAANSAATRARDAAFTSQTGPNADRSGAVNPDQAGKQAYESYLQRFSQAPQAQMPAQAPMAGGSAQAGGQSGGPAMDLLNRARLMAQYQGAPAAQAPAPAPVGGISVAAGPNMSTNTGLPAGSIGFARKDGSFTVQQAGGAAPQQFANEGAARQQFAGQAAGPMPGMNAPAMPSMPPASGGASPVPAFLQGGAGYSPQQINAMSPDQRTALVAFNQEQAAATQTAPELTVSSLEEAKQKFGQEYDYKLSPRAGGGFKVDGLSPRATPVRDVQTPAEIGASEAQKGVIARINKQTEEEVANAANTQQTLEEINTTRQAISSGAMTGAGQQVINTFVGGLARVPGVGQFFEEKKVMNDIATKGFASFAVEAAQRIAGQGQVTEKERELVAATVPQITDNKASIEFGLSYMEAVIARRQEYANLLQDVQTRLADNQITAGEAAKLTNKTRFLQENPIDVKALFSAATSKSAAAPTQATGAQSPAAAQSAATSPDIEAILSKYR
jgi:hypothetical protein